MRILKCLFIIVLIVCTITIVQSKDVDDYISEAEKLQKTGELDQAISKMKLAVENYPDNSAVYTHLVVVTK